MPKEKRPVHMHAVAKSGREIAKIFIDRLLGKWLKVGSSGVKWAIAPFDNER